MTKEKIAEALRGRLRCVHASVRGNYDICGDRAAGGHGAGYMASCKGGLCRVMSDVARGTSCSSCDFACGAWYRRLLGCQDDGELRKVLGEACTGWTPPAATNRIPGEAV